jgi:ribonuclease BN (tRNA processing enzyme)
MTTTRRRFLAAAGACGLVAAAGLGAKAVDGDARVVLLGTRGGPRVNKGPSNPANLVIAGGRSYVVDCGYGVTRQLVNAGVEAHEVRTILITHNHSDHMLELGPLIYSAWVGGFREPIDVWGPPPLARALPAFMDYMAFDIDTRIEDEGRPDLRKFVRLHKFEAQGPVFEAPGLKVSATRVRHPPIVNAYAYRFDTPGRSIVLSGDTTYSPELIAFAKGADVLVHEVLHLAGLERLLARVPNAKTLREHLLASHTTTEQLGEVAAQAQVKKLVMSHFVPGDDPTITDAMWLEGVRKNFAGEIVLGRDLMTV